jgi:catechol 2,3-dioxygenase-like lactoylglutathione lyase family enzyme
VKVRRIGFVGVRTDRVAETTAFFRDVVGLPAVGTGEHWTVTQLPTGQWDFVEVYSGDFDDGRLIRPETAGVFVAIFVEDLEEARRDCEAAGVEILGETIWAEEAFGNPSYAGVGWFFVRAPDGNVYVFQQAPD